MPKCCLDGAAPRGYRAVMDPTPGQLPPGLRPKRIGEIVNAAMKLYQQHWKAVIAISAVIIVPVSFVSSILASRLPELEPGEMPSREELSTIISVVVYLILLQALTAPLLTGGLSWLAARLYAGEEPSVQEALQVAFSRFLTLIWVGILTFFAVVGGLILLIIPGILISLRLTFSPTVVVVEGVKGSGALGRSWRLSRGLMGKIFLTLVLTIVLVAIVQLLVGVPFGIIGEALGGAPAIFFTFIGDALAGTISTPFAMIVVVLLYFDARVRQEGFDTGLLVGDSGPSS
jgi:hypothetical protein